MLSIKVMGQRVENSSITPDQSIAALGKVWGLLKYYHPQVAKVKLDWDQALIAALPKAEQSHTRDELAQHLLALINQLGRVDPCQACLPVDSLDFRQNLDLTWLDDSTTLTLPLRQQLHYIVANRNQQTNQYVHWNPLRNRLEFNEQPYEQMALPDQLYRLVGLIRYWNVIQYFHPAKYLLGRDWKAVLTEFVPKFRQATDTLAYQLVLRQLISTVDDGHAELLVPTKYRLTGLGSGLVPPFYAHTIGDTLLVTGVYNDSLSQLNGIHKGDRIVGIDGKSVSQMIDERSIYTTASNRPAKVQQLSPYLLTGTAPVVRLQVVQQGRLIEKTVNRYPFQTFHYQPANRVSSHKVIPANIGYVEMGQLRIGDIKRLMNQYKSYRGIIFDVRNYPNGTFHRLGDYLNSQAVVFARHTKPDLSFPGGFKFGPVQHTGRDNPDYYKGKVAILCNTYTQSAAESTCAALRTAPNAKIIGSQSAGANGDVSYISFPGDYKTRFTGTGVYTMDGRPIQRNGVPIDIEVKPSCDDVLSGIDKALQTAIEWINQ